MPVAFENQVCCTTSYGNLNATVTLPDYDTFHVCRFSTVLFVCIYDGVTTFGATSLSPFPVRTHAKCLTEVHGRQRQCRSQVTMRSNRECIRSGITNWLRSTVSQMPHGYTSWCAEYCRILQNTGNACAHPVSVWLSFSSSRKGYLPGQRRDVWLSLLECLDHLHVNSGSLLRSECDRKGQPSCTWSLNSISVRTQLDSC